MVCKVWAIKNRTGLKSDIGKNLHFLSHHADILPKLPTHELIILVENFLLIACFWFSPIFHYSYLSWCNYNVHTCVIWVVIAVPTIILAKSSIIDKVTDWISFQYWHTSKVIPVRSLVSWASSQIIQALTLIVINGDSEYEVSRSLG